MKTLKDFVIENWPVFAVLLASFVIGVAMAYLSTRASVTTWLDRPVKDMTVGDLALIALLAARVSSWRHGK